MKYYLYHIPGKKIGVTTNIKRRVTEQQGYKEGEYEILMASDNIDFISTEQLKKIERLNSSNNFKINTGENNDSMGYEVKI